MTLFPRLPGRWTRIRGRPATSARRILAALLFLAAGVLAVRPAAAQGGSETPVIVSAHDIAAGSVLRRDDVRVVRLPDSIRPAGTLSTIESVDGRLLAGAARAGEPITDARLVGTYPDVTAPGDLRTAVVPVRLADAGIAALLHPGGHVDVVTMPESGGRQLLAEMATVVTVIAPDIQATRPVSHKDGSLILLELPTDSATQVAAVSLERPVTVTLR
jgi:Flp pilus assembly protein CpaB